MQRKKNKREGVGMKTRVNLSWRKPILVVFYKFGGVGIGEQRGRKNGQTKGKGGGSPLFFFFCLS